MLLDQRQLDSAYEQIVQDAAKARGACTVIVFVAPNCDAMCACRILSYMLRADAVSYKIKPVAGYGDIAAANEELIKVRLQRLFIQKTGTNSGSWPSYINNCFNLVLIDLTAVPSPRYE